MNRDVIVERLAKEFETKKEYVANVMDMLDNGDTVPFISRYRKELHSEK